MKAYINILVVFFLLIGLTSCEVVGGIFKGGMWTGAILVIAVIGLVIWLFTKLLGGNK
ncbi:hypothetical protein ACFP1I_05270 [Dyadobacter subterraneus]|uniref:Phosphatidate cytidylyltransferase n=1 Tax=Dyadobacter subterraneus TaxID=2773304 RepID=A0ABR9WG39_9BACT|nr:hypothetical protein [Dyadobacter subterraneus]MBE9464458.1 hypothetical protein [Dyadobacter subterraneus]